MELKRIRDEVLMIELENWQSRKDESLSDMYITVIDEEIDAIQRRMLEMTKLAEDPRVHESAPQSSKAPILPLADARAKGKEKEDTHKQRKKKAKPPKSTSPAMVYH